MNIGTNQSKYLAPCRERIGGISVATERRGRRLSWGPTISVAVGILALFAVVPAEGRTHRTATVTIESAPPGALVSIWETAQPTDESYCVVAGETPLTREFKFGKKQKRLWIRLEKRGFAAKAEAIDLATRNLSVTLEPIADPGAPRAVRSIFIPEPQFDVTLRGFSKEQHSESKSLAGRKVLGRTIRDQLAPVFDVATGTSADEAKCLRSVWRDAHSAMAMVDPIRHAYRTTAPRLETRTARKALRQWGESNGVDAILLVSGHQNQETAGMKAGKVGLSVAGTAASYGAGYSNAISNGDSFFTYSIFLPSFAEGVGLEALMLECATGEILWINKGVWRALSFDQSDRVGQVVTDLLSGIELLNETRKEEETQ